MYSRDFCRVLVGGPCLGRKGALSMPSCLMDRNRNLLLKRAFKKYRIEELKASPSRIE